MPSYSWEAVTKEGLRKSGHVEAPSRAVALQELERQGLLTLRISEQAARTGRRFSFGRRGEGGNIGGVEKILICRHIAVMIRAGIAMNPALSILIADAEKPAVKLFLQSAQETIRRGQPFWTAFSAYGRAFPAYLTGLIRAGEASGQLAASFDQAADQLTREQKSRKQALSAMIYPIILFLVSFFLVLFLFLFAIPKLAEAIQSISSDLPLFSRVVFSTSAFLREHPVLVAAGIFLGLAAGALLVFSRFGHAFLIKIAWLFPPSRNFMKKFALARFARTLGSLMKAGLPAVEAVEITAGSVGIEKIRLVILDARERIRSGSTFTDAFRSHPEYFPNLLTGMMAVGEQSGQLSELLITVSHFFEDDADRSLQNLVALIEPLMLLSMGLLVGAIALSVILPIYQLVSVVGG